MPSLNLIRVSPPTKPTIDGKAYLDKIHTRYLNNPQKWEGLHATLFWNPSPTHKAIYDRWLVLQPARHQGRLCPSDKKWEADNWESAIIYRTRYSNWLKRRNQKIHSAYLLALKNYNIKFDAWLRQNAEINATKRPVIPLPDVSLPPPGYQHYSNTSSTREMSTQTEPESPVNTIGSSCATNKPVELVDKTVRPNNIQNTHLGWIDGSDEMRKLRIRIKDLESDNRHLESTRDDLLKTVLEYEDKSSKKKSGFFSKLKK